MRHSSACRQRVATHADLVVEYWCAMTAGGSVCIHASRPCLVASFIKRATAMSLPPAYALRRLRSL